MSKVTFKFTGTITGSPLALFDTSLPDDLKQAINKVCGAYDVQIEEVIEVKTPQTIDQTPLN